jgi:hypothetical protein
MPHFERPSSHGDLFVEYNVVLPMQLSTQTRQRAFNPSPLLHPCLLPHQVSLKHFMGKHLEIKTNYRLICGYCISSSCIPYILQINQPVVVDRDRSRSAHNNPGIAYQPYPAAQ